MAFDAETLNRIYQRTDGRCHICGKKLSRVNYAAPGRKGAWEVEHSLPRARGGTDHQNNLAPACISCNRRKGARTSKSARARHGKSRMPLSRDAKRRIRRSNALIGGGTGVVIGGAIGGPVGALLGGIAGVVLGERHPPE